MVLLKVLILAKVVITSGIKNETSGLQQLSEIQKDIWFKKTSNCYSLQRHIMDCKGNEIFKSSVTQDCDLFYPLTYAGFPMFQKGRIRFTKLSGMVPVECYH